MAILSVAEPLGLSKVVHPDLSGVALMQLNDPNFVTLT